jgi:hypothetical protein
MTCEYQQSTTYQDGAAAVLLECAELLERKSQDYNSNGIDRDDYYLYGRKSLMTMIHTKTLRLRSLIDQCPTDVNFESIQDTLKDLANYSAIWIDWERRHAND